MSFKILASNNPFIFNHEANFYGEIIRVFNLVIGYVLITNATRIAKFLDKNLKYLQKFLNQTKQSHI